MQRLLSEMLDFDLASAKLTGKYPNLKIVADREKDTEDRYQGSIRTYTACPEDKSQLVWGPKCQYTCNQQFEPNEGYIQPWHLETLRRKKKKDTSVQQSSAKVVGTESSLRGSLGQRVSLVTRFADCMVC